MFTLAIYFVSASVSIWPYALKYVYLTKLIDVIFLKKNIAYLGQDTALLKTRIHVNDREPNKY